MEQATLSIILGLIAAIPTTATVISTIWMNSQRRKDKEEQRKLAEKNAAKSSIENMITQDIIRAEVLHKLPENLTDIEDEYNDYARNGGNGKITRKVAEYKEWYRRFEKEHKV